MGRLKYFWQVKGDDEAVNALQKHSVPESDVFYTSPVPGVARYPQLVCVAFPDPDAKLLFVAPCNP